MTILMKNVEVDINLYKVSCELICDKQIRGAFLVCDYDGTVMLGWTMFD